MMDVVTVCHTPELHLLKLQARSIAQHLQPDGVGRLWVVLNEPVPGKARDYFDHHIAHEYGQFIDHVVVVERDELLRRVPVHRSRWGWRMQQVLKLRVACRIGSACYLILDAKNHFIRRVSVNSFFDGSTCFRSHLTSHSGAMDEAFRASFAYFGLNADEFISRSPPSITPFGVRTARVRELLDQIEQRENECFECFFMRPKQTVTEFFLIQALILASAGTLQHDFVFGRRSMITLFQSLEQSTDGFRILLDAARDPSICTFAMHRSVLGRLSAQTKTLVSELWQNASLLTDHGEIDLFTNPFDSKSLLQ